MRGKFEAPRRRKKPGILWGLILLLLAGALVFGLSRLPKKDTAPSSPGTETEVPLSQQTSLPPETSLPEPERVVAEASIASQGDLLMHRPIFTNGTVVKQEDGSFDFSSLFRYLREYTAAYDYAIANLETTFGGDGFPYQGNPSFNCPDSLLDAVLDAGYDLLLTANNHSYDTLMTGINRTLEQVRAAGLETLGTRLRPEEDRYTITEINGIQVGMVCYTYTMAMQGGKPSLNSNTPVEKPEQINYFSYRNLDGFYSEVGGILADMEAAGAEATMLYIHWGTEYEIAENATQNAIAQKMCDLGFDVIVGGHPHVVQPVELLTSAEDPDHKTVCIYSVGNAVSNQRIEEMRLKTGHTEDGVLFRVTFEKYSDGTVYLSHADVLPTWVNKHAPAGEWEYNILPLDQERMEQWQTLFSLTDTQYTNAKASYDRTMAIVGEGLQAVNAYLEEAKAVRDANYLEQARHPQ